MENPSDQPESGKIKRKHLLVGAGALVLAAILLVVLLRGPNVSQRLEDGSVLTLVEAKFGATNSFLIGDARQRMFARFIPSNGISIAGFKLKPPVKRDFRDPDGETLALLFRLSHARPGKGLLLGARIPSTGTPRYAACQHRP